jgi:hypothetical protein
MRHCTEQSDGPVPLSPCASYPGCITNICGYDFRKGEVSRLANPEYLLEVKALAILPPKA